MKVECNLYSILLNMMLVIFHFLIYIYLQVEVDSGARSRIWGLLRSVTTSSPEGESIAALKQEVAALEVSGSVCVVVGVAMCGCMCAWGWGWGLKPTSSS